MNAPAAVLLDADNTLYDWIRFFAETLRAVVFDLRTVTGLSMLELEQHIGAVFRRHGTVEYRYFLTELSASGITLQPSEIMRLQKVLDGRARRTLRPYAGVRLGLAELAQADVRIVCISDSTRFHLLSRLHQLDLARFFAGIYCSPDYEIEERFQQVQRSALATYTKTYPDLRVTVLARGARKPSQETLDLVLADLHLDPDQCAMLGDNLVKDVVMAKRGAIFDCWAEYGLPRSTVDVGLLVGVTDWSTADVEKFYANRPDQCGITPSFVATSFDGFAKRVLDDWNSREYVPLPPASTEQIGFIDFSHIVSEMPGAPL